MEFNKALKTQHLKTRTHHTSAGINVKPAFPHKSTCIHTHTRTHDSTGTTHTLVLIWNNVGGAGPVEGSVNSLGATPPFKRPKFPFLRSAAWAGSAVQQASSRHRRPQRPRWQHFTGTTAWQGWPDGPPRTSRGLTDPPHAGTHLMRACTAFTGALSHAFMHFHL